MIKNKDIYVYSLKLESVLRQKGFNCYKILPNIKYPNFNVFVHKYSEELEKAIITYKKEVQHD